MQLSMILLATARSCRPYHGRSSTVGLPHKSDRNGRQQVASLLDPSVMLDDIPSVAYRANVPPGAMTIDLKCRPFRKKILSPLEMTCQPTRKIFFSHLPQNWKFDVYLIFAPSAAPH